MKWVKEFQADIEHRSHKGQAGFNIKLNTLMKFLGIGNDREHGKSGFDRHPVIPSAFFAEVEVIRNTISPANAPIGKDNFVPFIPIIQEGVISTIHLVPNPAADPAESVE